MSDSESASHGAGFYSANGNHNLVFISLMYIFSIISSLFSVVMMVLLWKMNYKVRSLLWFMTVSQFVYDASFYPGVITVPNYGITVAANVFQLIGGIGVSIFSNIITINVLYTILTRKSVNVEAAFPYYYLVTGVPIVVECLLYLLSVGDPNYAHLAELALDGIYYYFRLISIFFNFLVCFAIYAFVKRMQHNAMSVTASPSIAMQAICVLAERLLWYPIIQAISRSGLAWYEFIWGFDFQPDVVTPTRFALQCYFAIITPLASVGYFIIFLVVQPKAYSIFRSWFPGASHKDGTGVTSFITPGKSVNDPVEPSTVDHYVTEMRDSEGARLSTYGAVREHDDDSLLLIINDDRYFTHRYSSDYSSTQSPLSQQPSAGAAVSAAGFGVGSVVSGSGGSGGTTTVSHVSAGDKRGSFITTRAKSSDRGSLGSLDLEFAHGAVLVGNPLKPLNNELNQ